MKGERRAKRKMRDVVRGGGRRIGRRRDERKQIGSKTGELGHYLSFLVANTFSQFPYASF